MTTSAANAPEPARTRRGGAAAACPRRDGMATYPDGVDRSVNTLRRWGTALTAVTVLAAGCASEGAASDDALDAEQATQRLVASCVATDQRLSQLPQPSDVASQAVWAGDIAATLDDQAIELRALVILDEDQRVEVRAFAENTSSQAAAWRELGELLGSGNDLSGEPRIEELTTEIAELSLGRDDLSDELGVDACRRG